MWCEAISKLKINLEKSELIPVGKVDDLKYKCLNWVVRWKGFLIHIWDFHWAPRSNCWQCGM